MVIRCCYQYHIVQFLTQISDFLREYNFIILYILDSWADPILNFNWKLLFKNKICNRFLSILKN